MIHLDKDWSTYKKLLFLKALGGSGANEYEITGNPVSFQTNLARPLSGFTIPFLPVQSGTGDPSPENIRPISGRSGVTAWGAGKNLLDPGEATSGKGLTLTKNTDGSIGVVGTPTGSWIDFGWHGVGIRAGAYMLSLRASIPCTFVLYYYLVGDSTRKYYALANGQTSKAITFEGEVERVCFGLTAMDTSTAYNFNLAVQMELGSTPSPYVPYTGQSYPVVFPAVGKNLLPDKKAISGNTIQFGVDTYSAINAHSVTLQPGTYTLSVNTFDDEPTSLYVAKVGVAEYSFRVLNGKSITFTISEKMDLRMWVYKVGYGDVGTGAITSFQLEKGSTPTAYEPFTNTVYGGTLDVTAGVLTVEWAKEVFTNSNHFALSTGTNQGNNYYQFARTRPNMLNCMNVLSNMFSLMQIGNRGIKTGIVEYSDNVIRIAFTESDNVKTLNDFDSFVSNNPLEVAYILATPYEIQLDPITVQTLIGDNTIWTDTNGENTIRYKKKE